MLRRIVIFPTIVGEIKILMDVITVSKVKRVSMK